MQHQQKRKDAAICDQARDTLHAIGATLEIWDTGRPDVPLQLGTSLKTSIQADHIWAICQELQLPDEVPFLAMEMLDRYILKSFSTKINDEGTSIKSITLQARADLWLILVTCIQLASKMTQATPPPRPRVYPVQTQRMLRFHCNISVSKADIFAMELEILDELEYTLVPSPYAHLQDVLAVVYLNAAFTFSSKDMEWLNAVRMRVEHSAMVFLRILYSWPARFSLGPHRITNPCCSSVLSAILTAASAAFEIQESK